MSFKCEFDINNVYFQHMSISFNRVRDKAGTRTINVKLSFIIIRLTLCELAYSKWRPEWLPDYLSDSMFQSFN